MSFLDFSQARSALRHTSLKARSAGVYHGIRWRRLVLVICGACLSRRFWRVVLYDFTRLSRSAGGWRTRSDSAMSVVNCSKSIAAMRRKECVSLWHVEGAWRSTVVMIGLWSEGDECKEVIWGWQVESDALMTRSSVWPRLWVGKWTCWVRLKSDNRDRNVEAWLFVGSSTWRLKSPVIR